MKLGILLPFLLAPVLGIGIGIQLYQHVEGEDEPAGKNPARASANVQQPEAHAGAGRHLAFNELMSIMRKPGAVVSAPALQAAFRAAMDREPGEPRQAAMRNAFIQWVLQAPEEALAHIDQIPSEDRQHLTATAIAALAEQQPDKFQRFATLLGKDTSAVLAASLGALAEKRPAEALDWIRQNPAFDENGELTAAVVPELLRADVGLAARVVASMKGETPVALIQQVAATYGKQDPDQAYRWVAEIIKDKPDASPAQVLNEVSSTLAAQDMSKAIDYMNRASDPEIKRSLMSEIAITKSQDDLATAWNWLNQYTNDPLYPDAAMNLVYRWSYAKPQEVAKILPTIGDPDMQTIAATHLARLWQQQDNQSFQQWVASLSPGNLRTAAMQY
jgi:hypothetical protein